MLSAAVAGGRPSPRPRPDAVLAAIEAVAGAPGERLLIVKNSTPATGSTSGSPPTSRRWPREFPAGRDRGRRRRRRGALAASSRELAGARGLAGTIFGSTRSPTRPRAKRDFKPGRGRRRGPRATASAVATMGVALSACTTCPPREALGFAAPANPRSRSGWASTASRASARPRSRRPTRSSPRCSARSSTASGPRPGSRMALMVNNLGGTPTMRATAIARPGRDRGAGVAPGYRVERAYVGTFLSALEMAGVSLSVLLVDDARLARLDAPTDAPAWPNAAGRPRVRDASPLPDPTEVTGEFRESGPARTPVGRALEAGLRATANALIEATDHLTSLATKAVGDGDLGLRRCARGRRAPSWRPCPGSPSTTPSRRSGCWARSCNRRSAGRRARSTRCSSSAAAGADWRRAGRMTRSRGPTPSPQVARGWARSAARASASGRCSTPSRPPPTPSRHHSARARLPPQPSPTRPRPPSGAPRHRPLSRPDAAGRATSATAPLGHPGRGTRRRGRVATWLRARRRRRPSSPDRPRTRMPSRTRAGPSSRGGLGLLPFGPRRDGPEDDAVRCRRSEAVVSVLGVRISIGQSTCLTAEEAATAGIAARMRLHDSKTGPSIGAEDHGDREEGHEGRPEDHRHHAARRDDHPDHLIPRARIGPPSGGGRSPPRARPRAPRGDASDARAETDVGPGAPPGRRPRRRWPAMIRPMVSRGTFRSIGGLGP